MVKHFVFAVAGIAVAAAVGAIGLKTAHAGDMPLNKHKNKRTGYECYGTFGTFVRTKY